MPAKRPARESAEGWPASPSSQTHLACLLLKNLKSLFEIQEHFGYSVECLNLSTSQAAWATSCRPLWASGRWPAPSCLLSPPSSPQRWSPCSGHRPQPAPHCDPASWGIVVTPSELKRFLHGPRV